MIFVGGGFGRRIALALLRHDMDQHRALGIVAHIAQHRQQMVEGMTVDRADMVEAHLLEQRAAGDVAARMFDGAGDGAVDRLAEIGRQFLAEIAEAHIGAAGGEARQIGAHGAGRRGDRHVVVVEDDDQPRIERAGIVQRLIGHAGRHRAVADDGNDVAIGLVEDRPRPPCRGRRRSRSRNGRRRRDRIRSRRGG